MKFDIKKISNSPMEFSLCDKCSLTNSEKFYIRSIYKDDEGSVLFLIQNAYPHLIFQLIETRGKYDFEEKESQLANKRVIYKKPGCYDFLLIYYGVYEPSVLTQIINDGYDRCINEAAKEAANWWYKNQNKCRKKLVEKQQFSHLRFEMRKELGNDLIVLDHESPDFIAIVPNKLTIGIEMTMCTPSATKMKNSALEYKIIKMLRDNEYIQSITFDQKIMVTIYPMPTFYKGNVNVSECCAEIETFVRFWHDKSECNIRFSTHIREVHISQLPEGTANIIDFCHIARRDAIRAADLLEPIYKKEEKLKDFKLIKDNTWLCIYLPDEENLHPKDIIYDEDCTEEKFLKVLEESKFKRIYILSSGPNYIKEVKPFKG